MEVLTEDEVLVRGVKADRRGQLQGGPDLILLITVIIVSLHY